MNYYPNGNYYIQDLQGMKDRIDNQIRQIQAQQPQPITQNFQIAPTQNNEIDSKFANTIDDVRNTFVMKLGLFINRDYTTLWVKDVSGNIRTFELEEVIELDEKDKEILELKKQIKEMKGELENERNSNNVDESTTTKKSTRASSNSKSNA